MITRYFFLSYLLLLGGGFFQSASSLVGEKSKGIGMANSDAGGSSDAFDTSRPHFDLSPAPPFSVLWRELEVTS